MKVLAKNVQLTFTCETETCNNDEVTISDPVEMTESGTPICLSCRELMVIDPECMVTN